jgi:hypothetical protein
MKKKNTPLSMLCFGTYKTIWYECPELHYDTDTILCARARASLRQGTFPLQRGDPLIVNSGLKFPESPNKTN